MVMRLTRQSGDRMKGWESLHSEDDKKDTSQGQCCSLTTGTDRGPVPDQPRQDPLFHANNFLLRNLHANQIYSGQ